MPPVYRRRNVWFVVLQRVFAVIARAVFCIFCNVGEKKSLFSAPVARDDQN